jgi:site-specific DNA-methyltransferase (adenine-specific)
VNAYYTDDRVSLYHGDCIEVMRSLPDNSVDAVVTDPPYGLEFMGKDWDSPWKHNGAVIKDPATERGGFQDGNGGNPYSRSRIEYGRGGEASFGFQLWFTEVAAEALRVLKPGGHLLAFGGTRTWHRLAVAIEDAGFEVRDSIAWMYGSGFPKSHDVSKAIDKRSGALQNEGVGFTVAGYSHNDKLLTTAPSRGYVPPAPTTPQAQKWSGFGTALKPAHEPIVVARKPLIGTVAENVLTHGTGALNIDGCRIGTDGGTTKGNPPKGESNGIYGNGLNGACDVVPLNAGRWPANVILDESQAAELDRQSGVTSGRVGMTQHGSGTNFVYGTYERTQQSTLTDGTPDSGGASRFFYVAKASKKERPNVDGVAHPTVKPIALMRYLVRLVTPPGGTVLEPFAGSGTTIEAALEEGFNVIGIEMTDEYLPLILARIERYGEKLC